MLLRGYIQRRLAAGFLGWLIFGFIFLTSALPVVALPVAVDSFDGPTLGARTVILGPPPATSTTSESVFTQTGGNGILRMYGDGNAAGDLTLRYTFAARDLTDSSQNVQFFINYERIVRNPSNILTTAILVQIMVFSPGGCGSNYSTGISETELLGTIAMPFINFTQNGGASCPANFANATQIDLNFFAPSNFMGAGGYGEITLNHVDVTPTGGAAPIPPAAVVEPAAGQSTPTGTQPINFAVRFNTDDWDLSSTFITSELTAGGSAPGPRNLVLTGANPNFNVAVSGMTGPGTVTLRVNANAILDTWGQANAQSSDGSITLGTPPAITSGAPPATVNINATYSHTFTFTGVPTPTISLTAGTLPLGIELVGNALSGTPTVAGNYTGLTVTASNGINPPATQNFSITVREAPTVTSPTSTAITSNSATLGGNVTSDGFATISQRGVVIAQESVNANPEIGGIGVTNLTTSGTTGVFTLNATSLDPYTVYAYRAYATNAVGTTYTTATTFTTEPVAPAITSGAPPAIVTVNTAYSHTFTFTGVPTPTISLTAGTLPLGIELVGSVLSGTPTVPGIYGGLTVTVTNGVTTPATQDFSITVQDVPTVTTPTATGITSNSATLGGNVTSDGFAAITQRGVVIALESANANPTIGGLGVTNLTTSGTTGVFTLDATGLDPYTVYAFRAYATNAVGTTYTTATTFTTEPVAPAITSGAPPAIVTVNTAYSHTFTFTGVPTPTISLTAGTLPLGIELVGSVLSGTPTVPGVYSGLTVTVTNGVTTPATQDFSITVQDVPTVTTPTAASVTSNSATLGGNVTSDGFATITQRGVVIALESVNANPTIGGVGVTNLTTSGTTGVFTLDATSLDPYTVYAYRAYATNALGTTYTTATTFRTDGIPPIITSAAPPATVVINTAYSHMFTATGIPAPTFSITAGTLPPGIELVGGVLSGTPTAEGNYSGLTVTASNDFDPPATQDFSIVVQNVPTVTTPTETAITSSAATLGGNVTSDGFTPIIQRGVVIAQESVNANPEIGGIGVTNLTTSGTTGVFTVDATSLDPYTVYAFRAYATNALGTTYTTATTFRTDGIPPVITSAAPPATVVINTAYSHTFTATGIPAPTFSITAGTLPPGIELVGGVLSGTPTAEGNYSGLTVTASNGFDPPATQDFSIVVQNVPTVTTPTAADLTAVNATLGGNVTSDGFTPIIQRGVVIALESVNANPEIGGIGVADLTASGTTGVFTVSATGLQPVTTYAYRAYAINALGATYTTATTFTTPVIGVSIDDFAIGEWQGSGHIPITIPYVIDTDVTFNFSIIPGTATRPDDYNITIGSSLMIAAGTTSTTIPMSVVEDWHEEADETFTIVLSNPSANAGFSKGSAVITIIDGGNAPQINYFTSLPILLTWNPLTWATGYEIQVSSSPNFTNAPVIAVNDLSYTLTTASDGRNYWRVRGVGGAWSARQVFIYSAP